MNTYDYLSNPVIPSGFYNVKCLDVQIMAIAGKFPNPLVVAKFQIVPGEQYGDAQNMILYVTLRQSADATELHQKFRQTFRVKNVYVEAIGRFGCIGVKRAEYKGTKYSNVHFINQSAGAKRDASDFEAAESQADIPWGQFSFDARKTLSN